MTPGIDSKESIPQTYVDCAGILEQSMGSQEPSWDRVIVPDRQGTKASGIDSFQSTPGLLKSLKISSLCWNFRTVKGGLGTKQEQGCRTGPPCYIQAGGTDSQESIPVLLKSFKIPSLAGRYENPIPTRFLAPTDCFKIPTQFGVCFQSLLYLKGLQL